MKLNMDKIVFESRTEIDAIEKVLETYIKEHGKNEEVEKMINLLDVMYMSW